MYVISYDIDIDRTRNRIAKTLLNYGHRVQYSVFECDLTQERYEKLYKELSKLITEDVTGSVRIYHLCGKCEMRVVTIGLYEDKIPGDDDLIVI